MGHAQSKAESFQSRTVLPPPLPTRSGIVPKPTNAARVTKAASAMLAAPGLAPLNISRAPKSPLPEADLQLALLPQWADANASLVPAKKSRFGLGFWIGSSTLSLAVGALVAAGLLGVRLPESAHASQPAAVVTQAVAHEPVAAPQPIAAPDMEIAAEEVDAHEQAVAAPTTVLVPQLTLTASKSSKSSKRGKASVRARAPKAANVVSTTWQPEPEAAATASTEAAEETTTAEAAAPVEAESAPAPEPIAAPEPVLPEGLTRDQVRQGMESKRGAVITCAKGAYGRVLADITIGQNGKVSSSVIDGTFAGTSVGSCMAGALRGAQFPAFSGEAIQVRYPFNF